MIETEWISALDLYESYMMNLCLYKETKIMNGLTSSKIVFMERDGGKITMEISVGLSSTETVVMAESDAVLYVNNVQ